MELWNDEGSAGSLEDRSSKLKITAGRWFFDEQFFFESNG
jgi:hypothetical protein